MSVLRSSAASTHARAAVVTADPTMSWQHWLGSKPRSTQAPIR
jgi:hypothetical protein